MSNCFVAGPQKELFKQLITHSEWQDAQTFELKGLEIEKRLFFFEPNIQVVGQIKMK
jgi:hypothetical protein